MSDSAMEYALGAAAVIAACVILYVLVWTVIKGDVGE